MTPDQKNIDHARDAARRRGRGFWRRVGAALIAIPATLVVIVVCLLMALEIDPVLDASSRWALKKFNPLIGASMNVENVRGGLLTGLVADGFTITADTGTEMVRVRSASGYLHLLPLLASHVSIGGLRLTAPSVQMHQRADSTWDLVSAFPVDSSGQPAKTTVAIRRLLVNNADVTLEFMGPDSTFTAWDIDVAARNLSSRNGLQMRLDSLKALFQPPGAADTVRTAIELHYADRALTVDRLSLVSDISDVSGRGTISLGQDGRSFDSLQLELKAAPLSFRDIQPFFQSLNPRAQVAVDVRAAGSGDSVDGTAEARFGDGSMMSATARASPPGAGSIEYMLDATVAGLDPRYLFASAPASAGKLRGTVKGEVRGTSRDSLSGVVDVRLDPVRYGQASIQGTDARLHFVSGEADIDVTTVVNGVSLSLAGRGRPFNEAPTYEAHLTFGGLDVSKVNVGRATSNLNGTMSVAGRGADWESAVARIAVQLRRSSWNHVAIPSANLTADLKEREAGLHITAQVGDGSVSASGRADLAGGMEGVRYSINRMVFEELPLLALLADTVRSSVSGSISGSGQGLDPHSMELDVAGKVSNSIYDTYNVRTGDFKLDFKNGVMHLAGAAILRGGETTFDISGRPLADEPRFEIRQMTFRSIDAAELFGASRWVTNVNGVLSGSVRIAGDGSTATLSVDLDSSLVNDQAITRGSIEGSLGRGGLAAAFDATTPQGSLSATANARPFDDPPSYHFSDGSFQRIDIGAIIGDPRLATRLNGRFESDVKGTDLDELVADAVLEMDESRLNSETIRSGRISISADSGRYGTDVLLDFSRGSMKFTGRAELRGDEPFELSGVVQQVDIASILGADSLTSSLNGVLEASGSGLRSGQLQGKARLHLTPTTYRQVTLQGLEANVTLDGKLLRVDTLRARSNVATLSGSGLVALSDDPALPQSDLAIEGNIVDLRPLHDIVPAARGLLAGGTVKLAVSGEPDDVRFRADGRLVRVLYKDLRVGEIDVRVVGTLDANRKVSAAESRVEVSQVSLPTLTARETKIDAAYADGKVNFEASSTLDDRRDIRTSGVVEISGAEKVLTLNTLRLRFDRDRWQLLQPSTISFGNEYRIQNFLLFSETQQIAVDGYIDLNGDQSLILTIEQFRIGSVADLLDYGGMNGSVSGYVDLTGPAEAPILTGSLTADIMSLNRRVGDLSLDLNYADLKLNIDGRLRNDAGAALSVDGHLAMDLRLKPPADAVVKGGVTVQAAATEGESMLSLKSDGFNIDWILPFLDPDYYSTIGGILTGQMDVRGTFAEPTLSGSAVLKNGSVGLTEFGVTYTNIAGDFTFRENRILVDRAEAMSGTGTASATGSISLSDLTLGDFDLAITSKDFLAVNNREYRASAGSDLRLIGSTRKPVLTGQVDVTSADIFLADEIEEFTPVQLSLEDLQTVEQRFGIRISEQDTTTFSFYEALSMELSVVLSRDTWLRSKKNPKMDIQFTGNLEVQKKAGENSQVFGSIEVIPDRSRIEQFGKSFRITKGTLTYNGPIDDPILDIQAEYDIRAWRNPENQVTITLTATGRFDDLDVKLSSDPAMEMTDIVSYIAFGRPASESLQLGGSGPGGSFATDLALGQLAGLIEDVAGSGLGLDVVEIEQQGLDARLTAGKYVHRRVYLAISQPLNLGSSSTSGNTSTPEITAEFELLQSLLLRVLSRRSSISVNLLWQYAY